MINVEDGIRAMIAEDLEILDPSSRRVDNQLNSRGYRISGFLKTFPVERFPELYPANIAERVVDLRARGYLE